MHQENDEERLGFFRKEVGHEYFLVHLFHPVEKVTEANAAGFVHNKPQLRFVTELFLDMSTSHCVRFDAYIVPIYVVHNEYFENEVIIFRHGMAGLYSISRKRMGVGMELINCLPQEFPVSNVATALNTGIFDVNVFAQPPTFLDLEYQKYLFRNRLAQHFVNAILGSPGRKKLAFTFDMVCSSSDFMSIVQLKEDHFVEVKKKRGSNAKMLTHDSIFQMKTPAVDITVEFESVEPLFKMLGSFFYFWPLTTSRNYQTGGLRDFEFVGMNRFNSTVGFSFDYYSNSMHVDGCLQKIPFELAYGAEAHSATMIDALSHRLCDVVFKDEETQRDVVVVSVERNMDSTLRNKDKEHLKFTGVVAWVFNLDGPMPSKWNKAHLEECKNNAERRYQLCTPMDPADFDVDQRTIPHLSLTVEDIAVTPAKKKPRKDREELTPDIPWKPSTQSSRASNLIEEVTAVSKFVKVCLSRCTTSNFRSLASRWLYRALDSVSQQASPDFRVIIQMSLELAPVEDMDMAFEDIFGLSPSEDSSPRSRNKGQYLLSCISRVYECAENFEA